MQLGMIGLGRMGANMVRRLLRHGHDCVVFGSNPTNLAALVEEGATGVGSLDEADFADRVLSAMRAQFGGHAESAPAMAGARP